MADKPRVARYVVGVDGSEDSHQAVEFVSRLARATGAEVVAVFALEGAVRLTHAGLYGRRGGTPAAGGGRGALVREFVQHWCRPLTDSGIDFHTIVEAGEPGRVISSLASRLDADLVVVGRRGRGPLAELVLGSVSRWLSHHTDRPLLLVSSPSAGSLEAPAPELAGAVR